MGQYSSAPSWRPAYIFQRRASLRCYICPLPEPGCHRRSIKGNLTGLFSPCLFPLSSDRCSGRGVSEETVPEEYMKGLVGEGAPTAAAQPPRSQFTQVNTSFFPPL